MAAPRENHPSDPLEECLKNARWPEPTGLERNRLEAKWDSLARQRVRFRRRLMRWTLAASLMLAMGIGSMLWKPGEADIIPPTPPITSPPRIAKNVPAKTEEARNPEPVALPPTRYEKLAFQIAVQHRRQVRVNRQPEPLLFVLNQLLKEPDANITQLCQPLQAQKAAYENLLLARIGSWNFAGQRAGLQVLKEIGSPRAIAELDRLSRDPELAKLAWPVALHLAPPKLLGKWAKTGDISHRTGAMQTLLSRREEALALGEFLHLVAQPDSRKSALEILQAEPHPPVDALFAFLREGTTEQRHTAGLVLGRMADPQITRRLLALAEKQAFPPEVMLALLNSPDRQAASFLKRAKQNPQAQAAVQLACLEWEILSYTSLIPEPLEIY